MFMRNYQDMLLDPEQSVVIIVDHQPQMYFGVDGKNRALIENSAAGLAKAAKLFKVPCVLTTVVAKDFSGYLASGLQQVYPQTLPIDRTSINFWEDVNVKNTIAGTGRKKAVLAGLWTEACVLFPALCMKKDGYDVYFAEDACGGASKSAHNMAVSRMVQAGVKPTTWMQVMLEWQRDWNNTDTYDGVMTIVKEHGGAYGLGAEYAETMLKKQQPVRR
jgi:nicotinamidase-related amidase